MKNKSFLSASLFALIIPLFVSVFSKSHTEQVKATETPTETILYENHFDSSDDNISNQIVFNNNVGKVTTGDWIQIPTALAESNNYDISFKIKAANTFYFHLHGLDASHDGWSIYLAAEGGGNYWSLRRQYEGDGFYCIYNNSGLDHGGLNYDKADFVNTYCNVRLVHIDGYLEVWCNNVRRLVTHLSNFGNNSNAGSKGRKSIEEGTIDYIALVATASNNTYVDDIIVKEPVTTNFFDVESNYDSSHANRIDVLDVGAQVLNHDNFFIESSWNVFDDTSTANRYYPRITLYGLNASLQTINNFSYGISVQSDHDGSYANPSIWYYLENTGMNGVQKGKETDPKGATPGDYAVLVNNQFTFRIEVHGDNFKLYCNNVLSIDQTFSALGMTKGHLQYIKMESGAGKAYWTKVSYRGFDEYPSAIAELDKGTITTGETATLKSAVFGVSDSDFYWYLDGTPTAHQEKELVLSGLSVGEYQYFYSNGTISSDALTLTVINKKIDISADKTTINPLESIKFTAKLTGDFFGEQLSWYVNDQKQTETTTTFVMSGFACGTYQVKCVSTTTESNIITVYINPGVVEISANKGAYFISEQAVIKSTCTGIQDPNSLHWYINNEELTEYVGKDLLIEMSQYGYGTILNIYAMSNELIMSNVVTILAAYDVYDNISQREEWTRAYTFNPLPDNMYGDFMGYADDETYLQSVSSSNPAYTFPTDLITNIDTLNYSIEYEIYVPQDISKTYYVYPCFFGINGAFPTSDVEIAMEVNTSGIYPYIKNSSDKEYHTDMYGFGVNTSYSGITTRGGWNSIIIAFSNNSVAYYINDTQVLFAAWNNMLLPQNVVMRMYAVNGDTPPLRFKNVLSNSVGASSGVLESVSLSASKIICDVNETVYLTAYCNPFDAKYTTVSFYINDVLIENNNSLELIFTQQNEGEYKVYAMIDEIKSKEKTITVKKDYGKDETEINKNKDAWFFIMVGCLAFGGILTPIIIKIIRRRHYLK